MFRHKFSSRNSPLNNRDLALQQPVNAAAVELSIPVFRSEKDVMAVLGMIRKEFNIDESRTYLMGHSMGGAGSIYLGVKYASMWAAVGAEAPATAPAGLTPDNYSLEPAKNIPMIIVQGDMDTLVPVAGTRLWIEKMKDLRWRISTSKFREAITEAYSPAELRISLRSSPNTQNLPAKSIWKARLNTRSEIYPSSWRIEATLFTCRRASGIARITAGREHPHGLR